MNASHFLLILTLLFSGVFGFLNADVIHVPDDERTVQEAVEFAEDGDTVLVAPDRYAENIVIDSKNIVLASRFIFTGDRADVDSTILCREGEQDHSVLRILNVDSVRVAGFTITGGAGDRIYDDELCGGGIAIERAEVFLKDLIIT